MAKPQYRQAHTGDVCQEVGQNSTKNGCAIKYSKSIERQITVNSLRNCVKLKVEDYRDKSEKKKNGNLLTNEKDTDYVSKASNDRDYVWYVLENSQYRRRLLSIHLRTRRWWTSTHARKRDTHQT